MRRISFAALVVPAVVFVLAAPPAVAQSSTDRTMPMRTPDGQPDVSGIFTFRTLTPFQRPRQFEGIEKLPPEEAAAFEAAERTRLNRDLFDPEKGAAGYRPRSEGGVLSYNEFWYERGVELTADKRTSLIIDPPDGGCLHGPKPPSRQRLSGAPTRRSTGTIPMRTAAWPTAASWASTRVRRCARAPTTTT